VADLLQLLVAGLADGAAYGLVAVGFVVVHSVTGIVNLTQGELAMLGGFAAISLLDAGLPLAVAAALAVVAVTALAGAMERFAIAPARGASPVAYLILTLGLSITLKAGALVVWGPDGRALPPLSPGSLRVAGVVLRWQEVSVLVATVLVAAALHGFLERTSLGKAFRACSQQPVAARLVGIWPGHMSRLSFLLAGAVGALAGVLLSPVDVTSWNSGLLLGLKGFVAASLAGMVSITGAILAGLALGVVESLSAGYVSSSLKDAVAFLVLLALMVARPTGLFAGPGAARA
jgi:branched-chain amino acid transport system permease protein